MTIEKRPTGTRGAPVPPRLVMKVLMPVMQRVHRRRGDRFGDMDVLYLHTVGARSGQPRTSPLARMDDDTRAAMRERARVAREELLAGEPRWGQDALPGLSPRASP